MLRASDLRQLHFQQQTLFLMGLCSCEDALLILTDHLNTALLQAT
jgi:hypothetical protein